MLKNSSDSPYANVDGSSTPVLFKVGAPEGTTLHIHRMIVGIRDDGTFSAEKYGVIANGLTNGLEIGLYNESGTQLQDLTGGINVKNNAGWGRLCYDVDVKTWGNGDQFLLARWTFTKSGLAITINHGLEATDRYLGVVVNDNLTSLVAHTFTAEGYTRP